MPAPERFQADCTPGDVKLRPQKKYRGTIHVADASLVQCGRGVIAII
jgi:hypothetical protein